MHPLAPLSALLLLSALSGCKPGPTCKQPDAPIELQLLTAAQPILNPDEDGTPWATNVRIYELKAGADLQKLEFETVYRDREKAFGDAFIRAHDYVAYPDRHTRWTLPLDPDTAHLVTVAMFRRPFGDAWYQVYDVPPGHAARRCQAEVRGDVLPDPCLYLAFERSEVDGGAFPPPGFELTAFEALCAPVIHDAPAPAKKKKKRRAMKPPEKLPTTPTTPQSPQAPQPPQSPQAPQAPDLRAPTGAP